MATRFTNFHKLILFSLLLTFSASALAQSTEPRITIMKEGAALRFTLLANQPTQAQVHDLTIIADQNRSLRMSVFAKAEGKELDASAKIQLRLDSSVSPGYEVLSDVSAITIEVDGQRVHEAIAPMASLNQMAQAQFEKAEFAISYATLQQIANGKDVRLSIGKEEFQISNSVKLELNNLSKLIGN